MIKQIYAATTAFAAFCVLFVAPSLCQAQIAGGYKEISKTDETVVATAKFAVATQAKKDVSFFQTKKRALVDKYFSKELADLLWKDVVGAGVDRYRLCARRRRILGFSRRNTARDNRRNFYRQRAYRRYIERLGVEIRLTPKRSLLRR